MTVCLRLCAAFDGCSVKVSLVVVPQVCCHLLEAVAAVVLNPSFHLLSPRLVCLAICLLLAPPTRPSDGITTALWAGLVDIDTAGNLQLHTSLLRLWYNASKHAVDWILRVPFFYPFLLKLSIDWHIMTNAPQTAFHPRHIIVSLKVQMTRGFPYIAYRSFF